MHLSGTNVWITIVHLLYDQWGDPTVSLEWIYRGLLCFSGVADCIAHWLYDND